jgi:hypothetical protein
MTIEELLVKIGYLTSAIENIFGERNWCKITEFNINSKGKFKSRTVSTGYASYFNTTHLIFQLPQNKQGFCVVVLDFCDGSHIFAKKYKNIFKFNLRIDFYFKNMRKQINRNLETPKFWNYEGGYQMDCVREMYRPIVEPGFNSLNLKKIGMNKLVQSFEELIDVLPDGPIEKIRLFPININRSEWEKAETYYWTTIAKDMKKIIKEGYGIFSNINNKSNLDSIINRKHFLNVLK